jgi:phosphate-selective porin OprO and OprP
MYIRNSQTTALTMKIIKICLLAIILTIGNHTCFLAEVSAQESVGIAKDDRSIGGDPESRLKEPSSKEATASKHILTRHQDGFYLYTDEDKGFQMRLGGGLQMDYRYYAEEERSDNRFDIRRARLYLSGRLFHLLGYRLSYEFEGSEPKNLLDAYGEIAVYGPNILKFGQFKVPFSLEQQTSDKDLFFAERSMGYSLEPRRDIGLGLRGHFLQGAVSYSIGIFNGDGTDGSSGGSQQDDPELAGRLVIAPFKTMPRSWLSSFQIGGSATYENIDISNVDLEVKSTGMVGTNRNLYVLNSNTKFGVLYDAGELIRGGLEAAWAIGPLALQGEYVHLKYTDLEDASGSSRDADFSSWYGSAVYWLTGEHPEFLDSIPQSIRPQKNFDPKRGGWGAFGIGCRIEHFDGDEDWIMEDAFVSVRKATAFSGAVNWVLNPAFALILDYTYTDLSDPIRVRVNPDGAVDYIDEEHVLTLRSQLVF